MDRTMDINKRIQLVIDDIHMLNDGFWVPDEDSCYATIDNLKLIQKEINELEVFAEKYNELYSEFKSNTELIKNHYK
jgi:hypothetical protein